MNGSGWPANYNQSSNSIIATGLSWNQSLAPGASITFGFNGSYSGSHTPINCQ